MFKSISVSLTLLSSFVTIYYGTISVTAQNIVTTINLNPKADMTVLPQAMGVNHNDNKLYVDTLNLNSKKRDLLVIDCISYKIIDTTRLPGTKYIFSQIEVDTTTKRIYICTPESNDKIYVINGTTNKIITIIKIEDGVAGITVNSVTNRIYVVNHKHKAVTVVDGKTNKIIDVIRLQEDMDFAFKSGCITVNPYTNRIYVLRDPVSKAFGIMRDAIGFYEDRKTKKARKERIKRNMSKEKVVIVIDGATNRIIDTIKLDFTRHITSKPYSDFSNNSQGNVSTSSIEINPVTNHIYIDFGMGGQIKKSYKIHNFIMGGQIKKSYKIHNFILVIDGSTNKIVDTIDTGKGPGQMDVIEINPQTNMIYLNNSHDSTVRIIDGNSNQVISSIKVGGFPTSIKAGLSNLVIYVTNLKHRNFNITVINDRKPTVTLPTLTVTPDSATSLEPSQTATVTLLDKDGFPLQGMIVRASTSSHSTRVTPHYMHTDDDGKAMFKFKFNIHFRENKKREIIFTSNRMETSITNYD